jgi:hypothetical protein
MRKLLVLLLAGFATQAAQAAAPPGPQELLCGKPPASFRAVLDYSSFDPGSGFFHAKNPYFADNYLAAEMICTGYTLDELSCIGFANRLPKEVLEVTFTKSSSSKYSANYAYIQGGQPGSRGGWPCEVHPLEK